MNFLAIFYVLVALLVVSMFMSYIDDQEILKCPDKCNSLNMSEYHIGPGGTCWCGGFPSSFTLYDVLKEERASPYEGHG